MGYYPLRFVQGQTSIAGDNTLIPAPPPGQEIVVSFALIQNASATATTYLLKAAGSIFLRVLGQNQGDGMVVPLAVGNEWRIGDAHALQLNLSGANASNYTIGYRVEPALR